MTARFRTFSQAPQAVRSARGRRRDRKFPAGAATDRAFGADKRNPVDLTVQVHGLRNISTAAAVWAIVRSHSFSPLAVDGIVHDAEAQFTADCSVLRIPNKSRRVPGAGESRGRQKSRCVPVHVGSSNLSSRMPVCAAL